MLRKLMISIAIGILGVLITSCATELKVLPEQSRNQFQSLPTFAVTPPEIADFRTPFSGMFLEWRTRIDSLQEELRLYLDPPSGKLLPSFLCSDGRGGNRN